MNHHKAKEIVKFHGFELHKVDAGLASAYWNIYDDKTTHSRALGYTLRYETPNGIQDACMLFKAFLKGL